MEDRFSQQLKKGVLEMLTLELICQGPTYGYALISRLKERSGGRFSLKEGTLYPILYRMEDEGLIVAQWSQGEGRAAPKKMYASTPAGIQENQRRKQLWLEFTQTVDRFLTEEENHDKS